MGRLRMEGWNGLERGSLVQHSVRVDARVVVGSGEESSTMIERGVIRRRIVAVGAGAVLLGSAIAIPALSVTAGPAEPHAAAVAAQNVDWLGADSAQSLNLGFPVLVPSWIPSPFGGAPSISTSDGYYSLYWMNGGGDPTFLQITGQVGGGLPGGSPYDLNNQLFINASVNGYDAIHDVTPIYDQVWWIQDGVLYNVNSKNLADTDSLSLANSLIPLDPGTSVPDTPTTEPENDNSSAWLSAPESVTSGDGVTVSVGGASQVNLLVDGGVFAETGDTGVYGIAEGSYTWHAPAVDTPTTFTFSLVDPDTGETLGTSAITVSPKAAPTDVPATEVRPTEVPATEPPAPSSTEAPVATEIPEAVEAASTDAVRQTSNPVTGDGTGLVARTTPVSSDGTDGPARPIVGGDGTGGIQSIEIPATPPSPYRP